MSGINTILVILVVCSLVASKGLLRSHITGGYKNSQSKGNSYDVNCSQFRSDNDVLRQLPFPVLINPIEFEYNQSAVEMDKSGAFVERIFVIHENVIPSSVFCLSKLKRLYSLGTPLHKDVIPDALSNLKELRDLYIMDARIVNITERLKTFSNLNGLVLYNCSLTHVPNLSTFQKLRILDLAYNRLSHLDGMYNVSFLDLTGNLFRRMPTMKYRDSLVFLDMSDNFLESTPPIASFINLQGVGLSNTNITSFPANIDKLRDLEFIGVSNNKISNLPTNILNLPKLETLDISNNLFSAANIQAIQEKFQRSRPEINLII